MNTTNTTYLGRLYKEGDYEAIKGLVKEKGMDTKNLAEASKLLLLAWSHYQLKEYNESAIIFAGLRMLYEANTVIGESARRGLAHSLLQEKGDVGRANELFQEIPPSLARDNLWMNLMIEVAKKGLEIPAMDIMDMISNATASLPLNTVSGHIINNACKALYEAREQKSVKPYLLLLPGLIVIAIIIYEKAGAAKNHIASVYYWGSLIFEAAGDGWQEEAESLAGKSALLWRELEKSQPSERFKGNLDNALTQWFKLRDRNRNGR